MELISQYQFIEGGMKNHQGSVDLVFLVAMSSKWLYQDMLVVGPFWVFRLYQDSLGHGTFLKSLGTVGAEQTMVCSAHCTSVVLHKIYMDRQRKVYSFNGRYWSFLAYIFMRVHLYNSTVKIDLIYIWHVPGTVKRDGLIQIDFVEGLSPFIYPWFNIGTYCLNSPCNLFQTNWNEA